MFENFFSSSSNKSKEKPEEKAKEYKKELYKEKKTSRAELRRERLEKWENLSEEKRKEKYGDRYERAKELYELEKTRIETVKLEIEVNKRSKFSRQIWDKISWGDKKSLDDLTKEYREKLAKYKEQRAERVSENVIATLNQNIKMAEQRALEKVEQSKFEKIRKGFKWLGDQNVEKVLKKFGKEPKNKFTKFASKFLSLRTVLSGGLIATGFAGSLSLGIAAFSARRFMGGAGTYFTSKDFMKLAKESTRLTFSEKEIDDMSNEDIEKAMAEFEARAGVNGENFQYDKNYKLLRAKYAERVKSKSELTKAFKKLDESLKEKRESVKKEEGRRKKIAGVISILTASAFSFDELKEIVGSSASWVLDKLGFSPDDTSQEIAEKGKETFADSTTVDQEILEEKAKEEARVAQETTGQIEIQTQEVPPSTIERGGSIWTAARHMVENGDISEEEFSKAWTSGASKVPIGDGDTSIHISEAGLSHTGDKVMYVPADGDVPAHFEVVDYPKDTFSLGSNQDLAEAFKDAGKEIPKWLEDSVDIEKDIAKELGKDIKDLTREDFLQVIEESAESTEEDMLFQEAAEILKEKGMEPWDFDNIEVTDGVTAEELAEAMSKEHILSESEGIGERIGKGMFSENVTILNKGEYLIRGADHFTSEAKIKFAYDALGNVKGFAIDSPEVTTNIFEDVLKSDWGKELYSQMKDASPEQLNYATTAMVNKAKDLTIWQEIAEKMPDGKEKEFLFDYIKDMRKAVENKYGNILTNRHYG